MDYLEKKQIDVLLPIGYSVNVILSKYKEKISHYVSLPTADYKMMRVFSDKLKTMKIAKKLGIPIPITISVNRFTNLKEKMQKSNISFPLVVKGKKDSSNIFFANSYNELKSIIQNNQGLIIQEYIPGDGYGFFALFNKGEARAIFMHKRIREYPITGGPSVVAESFYDSKLKKVGLKLLKELNWHGVAMVEFKKDNRDGEFKLIEVNPKFWGSLDLAIVAGVDFPYLTVKMATEGDIMSKFNYKTGLRFRWIFPGDVLYLLAKPTSIYNFISDFLKKNVRTDICLSDIKPNLFQFYVTISQIVSRLKKRSLKYPYGRPINNQ